MGGFPEKALLAFMRCELFWADLELYPHSKGGMFMKTVGCVCCLKLLSNPRQYI